MSNFQRILDSFSLKSTLNPKVWDNPENTNDAVMKPKVRKALMRIAEKFIEFLGDDIFVEDIVLTGSLSNFNWSEFSDFDLHVHIDLQQYEEQSELYKELFNLKKQVFNDKHDIKIFGYDVELYAQDTEEVHYSSGVYSVMNNEWLNKPKKFEKEPDKEVLKNKIKTWTDKIETSIEEAESTKDSKKLETIKDKLKTYRQSGLENDGELSYENLVFKFLRRSGHIEKLFNTADKETDKVLSIKESTTNIGGTFKTDLVNGPKNHSGRALGNWQSDNAWDIFSPPGTVVNSYTDGVVTKIRDTGKNSGKIFGTQVSIKGTGKFPDIFYTHLKNVKLKKDDVVKIGDYIGEISEWIGHESTTHVHIGLPRGKHLKDLLDNADKIFTGSKKNTKTVPKEDEKNFLSDLETITKSGKNFTNLKKSDSKISYDDDVAKIQKALISLGYLLPKFGNDGKFGDETEKIIKSFESDNNLTPDGKLSEKDLIQLAKSFSSKKN